MPKSVRKIGEPRPMCAVHHVELVCPACVGALGGKRKSKAKTAAAKKNAQLAGRPRTFPKCPRYGSHRFSKAGRCPCGYTRPD